MNRFPHYLKPCVSRTAPRSMVFFDTETSTVKETADEKQQAMKLFTAVYYRPKPGYLKDVETWTHGFTTTDLAEFILEHTRKKSALYIFSANIWFDLRVSQLFTYLLDYKWHMHSYFSKGKSFQLVLRKDSRTLRFLNIQNLFPVSVKKLGEVIGLPKLDVDFEKVDDATLLKYCYRDTEIIYKSVLYWIQFLKEHELGPFGITLPTQAMNAYRHRFMKHQIGIHCKTKVLNMERRAYFGGRCECWYIGEVKNKWIYYIDINSMYPYIMKTRKMPRKLIGYKYDIPLDEAKANAEKYCVIADCEIETSLPIYPLRRGKKVIYPTGRFETTLCTGTFLRALKSGHVKSVSLIARYIGDFIFSDWVKELYATRLKYIRADNKTYDFLVKRLMNSLYGKFGQRRDDVLEEGRTDTVAFSIERVYNNVIKKFVTVTLLGDYKRVCVAGVKEGLESFPAISAHVTDYGRLYLWDMATKAGRENVYYMDTDCLFLNTAGYKRMQAKIHATRLGAFDLEKKAKYLRLYGPKDYIFGEKKRIKGVPKRAEEIAPGVYTFDMFPGIRGELKPAMPKNYAIRKVKKELKREYDKGIVTASGRVAPFHLEE